jgi:hypothetical protein
MRDAGRLMPQPGAVGPESIRGSPPPQARSRLVSAEEGDAVALTRKVAGIGRCGHLSRAWRSTRRRTASTGATRGAWRRLLSTSPAEPDLRISVRGGRGVKGIYWRSSRALEPPARDRGRLPSALPDAGGSGSGHRTGRRVGRRLQRPRGALAPHERAGLSSCAPRRGLWGDPVPVRSCLHLKSAATRVGAIILVNRSGWTKCSRPVAHARPSEPFANALWSGTSWSSRPPTRTRERLGAVGLRTPIDVPRASRRLKGVTCSLVFGAVGRASGADVVGSAPRGSPLARGGEHSFPGQRPSAGR